MGPVSIGFGCAAVAVVAVSLTRGHRHPSCFIATMLLAFWAIANVNPPWIDPWMDVGGYMAALGVWFGRANQRWAFVVWLAFGAQLVIHLAFIRNPDTILRYQMLNCLFAVQLMATAFPGVVGGVRSVVGRLGLKSEAGDPHAARYGRPSLCCIGHRRCRHRIDRHAVALGDLGSPAEKTFQR